MRGRYGEATLGIALSLAMLATFALICGAVWQWRRPGMRRKAVLMVALAAILLGNIVLWTWPDSAGRTLARQVTPPR